MPLYFRGLCSSCFIDSKSVVWPKPDIGAGSTAEYCKLLAVTAAQQNNVCCTLVFTHDKVEKSCKIWLLLSGSRFSGNLGGECSAAQTARWQDFFLKYCGCLLPVIHCRRYLPFMFLIIIIKGIIKMSLCPFTTYKLSFLPLWQGASLSPVEAVAASGTDLK